MKRARKEYNVHGEVHFKQKPKANHYFYWKYTLPQRASCKGAENFIVDKIACHQHATVPKMNSPLALPRNHNRFTKTKTCMETPLNKNLLRIEAKKNKK